MSEPKASNLCEIPGCADNGPCPGHCSWIDKGADQAQGPPIRVDLQGYGHQSPEMQAAVKIVRDVRAFRVRVASLLRRIAECERCPICDADGVACAPDCALTAMLDECEA